MTRRHDIDATSTWMREGTAQLLAVVDKLSDEDIHAPSLLPGWTRAHVIGHVARNAEALHRLASWARTGVESPMYTDAAQRAREIEQSAALPADRLRAELAGTATSLGSALDTLTPEQWSAQVRSALGRAIPAAEVPWMRVREVWLHAVDLDNGATVRDLPPGVVDTLLDDVSAALTAKDGCPPVQMIPTDRERTWQLGSTDGPTTVAAPAAELAGWVTGRLPGTEWPTLPRWI